MVRYAITPAYLVVIGSPQSDSVDAQFSFVRLGTCSAIAFMSGGGVFSIVSKIAWRDFVRIHIDIGFGDIVLGEPECLPGNDLMAVAGIAPAKAYVVPMAQQFAE